LFRVLEALDISDIKGAKAPFLCSENRRFMGRVQNLLFIGGSALTANTGVSKVAVLLYAALKKGWFIQAKLRELL